MHNFFRCDLFSALCAFIWKPRNEDGDGLADEGWITASRNFCRKRDNKEKARADFNKKCYRTKSTVVRMICRHLNNSYSILRFFISLTGSILGRLFRTVIINHSQAAYVMAKEVFRYIQTFITITKAELQKQDKLHRTDDLQLGSGFLDETLLCK